MAIAIVAIAACSSGDRAAPRPPPRTPPRRRRRARRPIRDHADDWPVYGHDAANSRLSPRDPALSRSSVARLRPTWSVDGLVGVTGTPVVADGTRTSTTGAAPSTRSTPPPVKSGGGPRSAARSSPHPPSPTTRCSSPRATRSTASTGPPAARSGRSTPTPIPTRRSARPRWWSTGSCCRAPRASRTWRRSPHYTFRGSIAAYDVATGHERWRFDTTPDNATAGAGAGIWSTPAIDRRRGLLFVGTGQTLEEPTAPLADSILAIRYRTGKLLWSRQFTYPDVFSNGHPVGKDADVGASPNLWTSNGRDLVGAGDKGGTFHALDREYRQGRVDHPPHPRQLPRWADRLVRVRGRAARRHLDRGRPRQHSPTDSTKVFALDPASGRVIWMKQVAGKVFAPVSAVPRRRLRGERQRHDAGARHARRRHGLVP